MVSVPQSPVNGGSPRWKEERGSVGRPTAAGIVADAWEKDRDGTKILLLLDN